MVDQNELDWLLTSGQSLQLPQFDVVNKHCIKKLIRASSTERFSCKERVNEAIRLTDGAALVENAFRAFRF